MSPETTDKKRRVNAKQFLSDFRSGMTDEELMRAHGLTARNLEKLLGILVEKGLLGRLELKSSRGHVSAGDNHEAPVVPRPAQPSVESPPVGIWPETQKPSDSSCPQCGARVSAKALICPECGHVLSGEERWEQVNIKKTLTERVHPLILGSLLALPIAIALFFFFKDVLLPASKAGMDQRIEALNKETPAGKTPMQAAKDMARDVAVSVLVTEVRDLISQGILADVDQDYTTFTAGPRWDQFSQSVLSAYLANIRDTMRRANLPVDFEVVEQGGRTVARVTADSISFEGVESIEAPIGHGPGTEPHPVTEPGPPETPRMPVLPVPPAVRDQLKQFQRPHQPAPPPGH